MAANYLLAAIGRTYIRTSGLVTSAPDSHHCRSLRISFASACIQDRLQKQFQ
jgi:hypothetical protein